MSGNEQTSLRHHHQFPPSCTLYRQTLFYLRLGYATVRPTSVMYITVHTPVTRDTLGLPVRPKTVALQANTVPIHAKTVPLQANTVPISRNTGQFSPNTGQYSPKTKSSN